MESFGSKILRAIPISALLLSAACASTVPPSYRPWAGDEDNPADASLAADVHTALLDKLGRDAMAIEIDVDGGRVRLSGHVDERSTQELAEEVALSVQGVERVENRLELDSGERSATPVGKAVSNTELEVQDAVLELRVGKNLLAEIGRYALDLEVESTDGVVSLRGRLPDRNRKRMALKVAKETSGVRTVIDLLDVD